MAKIPSQQPSFPDLDSRKTHHWTQKDVPWWNQHFSRWNQPFFLVKPAFLCMCPIVFPLFSQIFGAFSALGLRAPACARASWAPASKEPRSTQRQKQLKGPNLWKWGENPWHICWCSTHGDPWYDGNRTKMSMVVFFMFFHGFVGVLLVSWSCYWIVGGHFIGCLREKIVGFVVEGYFVFMGWFLIFAYGMLLCVSFDLRWKMWRKYGEMCWVAVVFWLD